MFMFILFMNITNVNLVDVINFKVKRTTFKKPLIIEGFQGVGLVGTLTAQYLVQKLNLEQIGYVDSEGVPPIAMLVNGNLLNPIKIFSNKKRDLIIIESELSIPRKIIYELSEEITKWAKKINAREILCLEGISVPESERNNEVYGMSTDPKITKNLTKKGVKILKNGIILGMSAQILLKSKEKKIPATCLFVESRTEFPDGMAAASLVETLNKLYNFNVDVSDLRAQAKEFEKKIENVLSHAKHLRRIEGTFERPSIYG